MSNVSYKPEAIKTSYISQYFPVKQGKIFIWSILKLSLENDNQEEDKADDTISDANDDVSEDEWLCGQQKTVG